MEGSDDKFNPQLYRVKSRELQMDLKPMYFVNFGTRYQFWNKRARLSLNFNDVFDTQEIRIYNGRPFNQKRDQAQKLCVN